MPATHPPHQSPAGWDADSLRAPHAQPDKAARVRAMFDAIAPAYERVNTVATLGRDAVWRRKTVAAAVVQPGDVVLDVCCGTGDMLRTFVRHAPTAGLLIGVDFAANMLAAARKRGRESFLPRSASGRHGRDEPEVRKKTPDPFSVLIRADALRLPLADGSVDVISCVFGVRNFRDLHAGLQEMFRVARPGARVVILEFATPVNALWRWAHRVYCDTVLPRIGALLSRDRTGAYRYLPRSIQTFEPAAVLASRLADVGFHAVTLRRMNFGGVVLYRALK